MRSSTRSLRAMLPLLVVLAAALVMTVGQVANAQTDPGGVSPAAPSGGVAEPTVGDGTVSSDATDAPVMGDGAQHVKPNSNVRDPRPVAIDHIAVAADGVTVTIYYWGGTDTCYALASVDVTTNTAGVPVITVNQGTLADLPPDQACIEIAVLYATTITLDQPVFIDGSQVAPAE